MKEGDKPRGRHHRSVSGVEEKHKGDSAADTGGECQLGGSRAQAEGSGAVGWEGSSNRPGSC